MTTTTAMPDGRAEQALPRSFHVIAWRWHFYAGLYAVPFLLVIALTSSRYVWPHLIRP